MAKGRSIGMRGLARILRPGMTDAAATTVPSAESRARTAEREEAKESGPRTLAAPSLSLAEAKREHRKRKAAARKKAAAVRKKAAAKRKTAAARKKAPKKKSPKKKAPARKAPRRKTSRKKAAKNRQRG